MMQIQATHGIHFQTHEKWIEDGTLGAPIKRHHRQIGLAENPLRIIVESHTLLSVELAGSSVRQLVISVVFPAQVVIAAVGGKELHEVVRVGIVGSPTVAKYGKGIVLQLLEINLPFLIFQTDDNPQ